MYAKKQEGRHKETTTAGTESLSQQMEADMKKHAKKSESEWKECTFLAGHRVGVWVGSWSWGLMAAG